MLPCALPSPFSEASIGAIGSLTRPKQRSPCSMGAKSCESHKTAITTCIRQHTSAYISIRKHTIVHVSTRKELRVTQDCHHRLQQLLMCQYLYFLYQYEGTFLLVKQVSTCCLRASLRSQACASASASVALCPPAACSLLSPLATAAAVVGLLYTYIGSCHLLSMYTPISIYMYAYLYVYVYIHIYPAAPL
jgi:hypothetical protein